jgi:S-(hydroxymethyl)glutathione dehydrogenase/alcohol dehydrogenase
VGDDVTDAVHGDHVVCCVSVFCGRCRQCLSGHPYRCTDTAATERRAGDVIVAVDLSEHKLDLARRLGATHAINAAEVTDVVTEVRELTDGGVHHSFEAIGLKAAAEQAYRMVDVGGTATIIGMVPSNQPIEVRGIDLLFGRTLRGSNQFRVDIPRLVGLYFDGRLLLDEMISDRITLDEINESYEQMRHGAVARAVVML